VRIDQYRADGAKLSEVKLPVSRPTSLAFGGTDLTTLFVTSQRRFLNPQQLSVQPFAGALLAAPGFGPGRRAHFVRL
jgi:sugar lactone lactonase YvrE